MANHDRVDPTTIPVTVSLVRLKCIEQEDSEVVFDTQDDEPYVLVTTVDGQGIRAIGGVTIPLVTARLVRIGPISDFDKGDIKIAPVNILWGVNGFANPIANINRVFFLVALLENDSADPEDVENRVVTIQAALPGLATIAFARNDLDERGRFELFASTARQAMDGMVSGARLAFPDPDDQIGDVQVLRFSDQEQQDVLNRSLLAFERTLRFEGDDAVYELTFSIAIGFLVVDRTPIAALRRHEDHMELWVVDSLGAVRGAFWDGDWHPWYTLFNGDTTFPQRAHLAVLHRHRDHMELFGIGEEGRLHNIWWDGEWHEWGMLGAPIIPDLPADTLTLPPGAPLAVRSRFSDHMEVWVVGADRQVHAIWWDGTNWRDWYSLPGALFPVGAQLSVHSRHDDHMEIWGVDETGTLRGNWWNGSWQGWYALQTPANDFSLMPGASVAVVGRNEDHMELWSVGGDDRLHGIWWNGDWQEWYTLDAPFSFPPGAPLVAIARNEDLMEIWVAGDDNRLHGVWWNDSWQPWYTLDQSPVPRGTPLAALSRNDDHMEVWCVASDDPHPLGVHGVWWDGEWHPFYRVG